MMILWKGGLKRFVYSSVREIFPLFNTRLKTLQEEISFSESKTLARTFFIPNYTLYFYTFRISINRSDSETCKSSINRDRFFKMPLQNCSFHLQTKQKNLNFAQNTKLQSIKAKVYNSPKYIIEVHFKIALHQKYIEISQKKFLQKLTVNLRFL